MDPKLKIFLLLGLATTLTSSGSALIGLTLAFDSWRVTSITENNVTIKYIQGILKECMENGTQLKQCYTWKKSITAGEIFELQELLFSLIITSCACGGLSLLISLTATTSRVPKFVIPVTALELACCLLGISVLVIYTVKYISKPWSPSWSYFGLWAGTIFVIFGLIVHTCLGDVKLFGKKFFVTPTPSYRYHKGATSLLQVPSYK